MTRPRFPSWNGPRSRPSGVALIFVLALVLVLAVAGIALIRFAGQDRVDAARLGREDRGLVCAEAGLQYARRFFGACFTSSDNWNNYLSEAPGFAKFTYLPPLTPQNVPASTLAAAPLQTRGASDGVTLDPGSDLDGDGRPDFWVSIRDDADEVAAGAAATENPAQDNNGMVIIRSECTNPAFALIHGGSDTGLNRVIEATITFSNQNAMAGAGSGSVVCQTSGATGGSVPSGVATNSGTKGNNL